MAKKPNTRDDDEAIAKGLAIAKEIDEEDGRLIAEEVVETAAAKVPPVRQRKFFDHTGVQPPVEAPASEIVEISTAGAAQPPTMTVTLTRALTMGSTMHPEGANVSVPIVYGEMLLKSGAAVVADEQPRPPEPPPTEEESPEPDEE